MQAIKTLNLVLAFALELAMLAAFAIAGLRLGGWMGWVAAVVAVVAGIALWAVFGAPRSPRRLQGNALLGFKVAMFGLAVVALAVAGEPGLAIAFGVLAAANLLLARAWGQE